MPDQFSRTRLLLGAKAVYVLQHARVMRRELKKRQVKHLKVVYSTEEALTPLTDEGDNVSAEGIAPDVEHISKRRSTPGSVAFVPSVAGLIIGGEVIKDLTKDAMERARARSLNI